MKRRTFFSTGLLAAGAAAQVPDLGKSKMKITSVRLVNTRPKRPVPAYEPAPGSWSTQNVEVANPMSIYPEYKATRSLFFPDAGKMHGFTVEIAPTRASRDTAAAGPAAAWW